MLGSSRVRLCSGTGLSMAGHRRGLAKLRTTEVTTGFDIAWRNMNDAQKSKVAKEYSAYEAQDWHALTLEQKRASKSPLRPFHDKHSSLISLHDCLWSTRDRRSLREMEGPGRSCGRHCHRHQSLCLYP